MRLADNERALAIEPLGAPTRVQKCGSAILDGPTRGCFETMLDEDVPHFCSPSCRKNEVFAACCRAK